MAVDLHLHTIHSDGSLTPSQLVQLLKKLGVKTFAITDHDTINAIKEADLAAYKNGMRLITGVELSIEYPLPGSAHLHLLGLFVDVQNEQLNSALKKLREERKNRAHLIIRKLEQMGIALPSSQKEKLV
ncbi:PHP domain-containing protein, partial [Caldithrix abyssi]